jgi:hypothetical protein
MSVAWLLIPLLIVLGLAGYAAWLMWQLRQHRRRLAEQEAQAAARQAEHEACLAESVCIIAHNVVQEDLNVSEAVLRLRALLTALGVEGEARAPYRAIDELAERVEPFATHQARQALSVQERRDQDTAREAHERAYRERVLVAMQSLQTFVRPSSLS